MNAETIPIKKDSQSAIQWQLFLDKFGNHKHWKEWLEKTGFGPDQL